MRKIVAISIGLVLLTTIVLGFASAETETTYYCYGDGGWRPCTDSEAILAKEAMSKETPVSLSRDEMDSLITSRDPYWNYVAPAPTPAEDDAVTPVPTPKATLVPASRTTGETVTTYYCYGDGGWRPCTGSEALLAEEAMKKETPMPLSRDEMDSLITSRQPFWNYNAPVSAEDEAITPVPTPTISPTPTDTTVPGKFWDSVFNSGGSTRTPSLSSRFLNLFR